MKTQLTLVTLTLSGVLGMFSPGAHAQSGESAAAQALFDDAKQLMKTGHVAEACPKLEESQRLDPSSGTLLNLANCYELTKRLASAWSAFIEAGTAAHGSGNLERERVARQRAAQLAPRLPKLMITVPPELQNLANLEITRDGVAVHAPEWGVALPADTGEHAVTAHAPGYAPFETKVSVEGERSTATVDVPMLVALPPEPTPTPPAPTMTLPPPAPAAPPEKGLGTARTVAIVSGAVGVVGVVLGAAFGLASKSKHDQANGFCKGSACTDQRGVDYGNQAQTDGNIATAMMIVGGVGLAAGATLWFTAPKRNEAPSTQVGLGFGTVRVKGTF